MENKGFFLFEFIMIIVIFSVIVLTFVGKFYSSKVEARLYNNKYGTDYTTADFLWSGGTIKEFLQGGKQNTQNINFGGAIPVKIQE